MYSRFVRISAASLLVWGGGVVAASAAELGNAPEEGAGPVPVAGSPYGAERYGYYPPLRYGWRPWYSDSYRGDSYRGDSYRGYSDRRDGYRRAPSSRYAPRWRDEERYGLGSRYYAPRGYGRAQPYWGYDRRPYYDRPYDDHRWTGWSRPVLPRWAGAARDWDGPQWRSRSW